MSNLSHQSGNSSGGQSSSGALQLAVRKFSQPNVVHLPLLKDEGKLSSDSFSQKSTGQSYHRPTPIIGTKVTVSNSLTSHKIKASTLPRPFHIYVGNLDINTQASDVENYLVETGINVLSGKIVRTSKITDPFALRSVAAHVEVTVADKDKVFLPDLWDSGVTVRPRRRPRQRIADNNDW